MTIEGTEKAEEAHPVGDVRQGQCEGLLSKTTNGRVPILQAKGGQASIRRMQGVQRSRRLGDGGEEPC